MNNIAIPKFTKSAISIFLSIYLLLSCHAHALEKVVVGSKLDTEGMILGTVIISLLKDNNIPYEDKLQYGPTQAIRSALLSGAIHIYPEYTGNGSIFFKDVDEIVWHSAELAFSEVKRLDAERNKIVWITKAPANNVWSIGVTKNFANTNKIYTMDDFANAVKRGFVFRLAASEEFITNPSALPTFERVYGFSFPRSRIISMGADSTESIKATINGDKGINCTMMYGTDATEEYGLQIIEDVKGAQPAYQPSPVARLEVIETYSVISDILTNAFSRLTFSRLRDMNKKVVVDKISLKEVVEDFLHTEGLLKK